MDLYLGLLHRLATLAIVFALAIPLAVETPARILRDWNFKQ